MRVHYMSGPVTHLFRHITFLTLFSFCCSAPLAEPGSGTLMRVLVVFGAPGHSSVHLQRDGQQLYWDPGGAYGTEKDDCLEYNSDDFCGRFNGFPLERLKRNRRFDVFFGDDADLMRVVSIYHLDGDVKSQVYHFELHGNMGRRAWDLLHQGWLKGRQARFRTDRNPMFCVKAVTEYLAELGGEFKGMPSPWFPSDLAEEMARRGARPSRVYKLHDPAVTSYIAQTRRKAGLAALGLDRKADRPLPHQRVLPAGFETWEH